MHLLKRILLTGVTAGLLSACGGAGSSSVPNAPTLPIDPNAPAVTTSSTPTLAASPAPVTTDPNATAATTIPPHVITGDFFGTPWGTTAVAASSAAPHLSWALTDAANTNAIAAAGIKTEVYFDPSRTQAGDVLYATPSSAFAHACAGSKITDYWDGSTQYLMNNASSGLRSAYADYEASRTAGHPVSAVYEDDVVAPGLYRSGFFSPGLPCDYSISSWISNERGLEASINHPTILNGLSGLNGHDPSPSIQVMNNASTIGGNFEGCGVDSASHPLAVWVWEALENTQLQVTAKGKFFQCMVLDHDSASAAHASRMYALASFLMTYSQAHSILWETYWTPTRFHVLPESRLVPTSPVVATPSAITSLKTSTGVFVREYRACFYAGRLIGACAMVVNNSYYTYKTPHFALTYHHTLTTSGYDVLEGGTVGFAGSGPPYSMAPKTAFVAVP